MISAVVYFLTTQKIHRSLSFFITLVVLPGVVAMVISLVGTNIASAFSLAGVFTLVRFRSAPGAGKDISFIFLAMASGLACAFGYISLAYCVVIILCAIIAVLTFVGKKYFVDNEKTLRVVIPEDMNYNGAFDDLFATYVNKAELIKVKTTNMGTLYELTYTVDIKKDADEKKLLDELRCRNGNLTITLCKKDTAVQTL